MTDRALADLVVRALLAIAAAIRKRYNLPVYQNINIIVTEEAVGGPQDHE